MISLNIKIYDKLKYKLTYMTLNLITQLDKE